MSPRSDQDEEDNEDYGGIDEEERHDGGKKVMVRVGLDTCGSWCEWVWTRCRALLLVMVMLAMLLAVEVAMLVVVEVMSSGGGDDDDDDGDNDVA